MLGGSDVEVIEYIVNPGSPVTEDILRNLNFPKDAIIGGIIRGSEAFIATGDTLIRPYDRVAVFTKPGAMRKVEKLFS